MNNDNKVVYRICVVRYCGGNDGDRSKHSRSGQLEATEMIQYGTLSLSSAFSSQARPRPP